ncbi:MAG: hypothetical protein ACRC6V_05755 [Bacteroidales bacterium]
MHNELKKASANHKALTKQMETLRGDLFGNSIMRQNVAEDLKVLKEARQEADMNKDFVTVSGATRAQNVMKRVLTNLLVDRTRIIGQLTVIGLEVRELKARILVLDAKVEDCQCR